MTNEYVERFPVWHYSAAATTAEKIRGKADRNGVLPDDAESNAPNLFVFTLSATDAADVKAAMPVGADAVVKSAKLLLSQVENLPQCVCRIDFLHRGIIVDSICSALCPPEFFRYSREEFSYTGTPGELVEIDLPYYFCAQERMYFPIDLDAPDDYQYIVYCEPTFAIETKQFEVRSTVCTRYRDNF